MRAKKGSASFSIPLRKRFTESIPREDAHSATRRLFDCLGTKSPATC